MISQMLRDSALRFARSADLVCCEYSQSIQADALCCPSDRQVFNQMIVAKLNQNQVIPITSERLSA